MRNPYAVAFAGALLLTGCASVPKVDTEAKPGTDFSRFKTFALLPLPTTGPASDPGLVLRVGEPARQAVVEALTGKGLAQVERAQADIAINLQGHSIPKVEVTDYGFHYPVYTRYGRVDVVRNPYSSVSTYDERTLRVEIYDNKSKDEVWAGWATTKTSGAVSAAQVTNAIHHILAKFPPGAAAP